MDIFQIIIDWYKWILAIPGIGALGWLWKKRKQINQRIKDRLFQWLFKEKFDELTRTQEEDAKRIKYCTNCKARDNKDIRLIVLLARPHKDVGLDIWRCECPACKSRFDFSYKPG